VSVRDRPQHAGSRASRCSRSGGVLAVTACVVMMTGCSAIHLNFPLGASATPTPSSATLDKGEQAAVKAMEASEGVHFLVRHPVVTVRPSRALGTAAFEITLTGPYFVDPSFCVLGIKYHEAVHRWFRVTYAPHAAHQYDQATYRNGPDIGIATVSCR
jgi:hypothetical protein